MPQANSSYDSRLSVSSGLLQSLYGHKGSNWLIPKIISQEVCFFEAIFTIWQTEIDKNNRNIMLKKLNYVNSSNIIDHPNYKLLIVWNSELLKYICGSKVTTNNISTLRHNSIMNHELQQISQMT